MPKTLFKSRIKAFKLQQRRCIYCEQPIWIGQAEEFADKCKPTIHQARALMCTGEHLKRRQDSGNDCENNIAATCHYCNQNRHRCKPPKEPISYKHFVISRVNKGNGLTW